MEYEYFAADAFPKNPKVFRVDLNDLSSLFDKGPFDFISCFRSSMFIEDKHGFLDQVSRLLRPGGYLAMDYLIGNSTYPVIGWDNEASYDGSACFFKTTFFDESLIREFRGEVEQFCRHVRVWPLSGDWPFHLRLPLLLKDFSRWRRSRKWRDLSPEGLGEAIEKEFQDKHRFSLEDYRRHGMDVVNYQAKYFYPEVGKFNLFNLVVARKL